MSRRPGPLAALAMVALIGVGCSNEPAENGSTGNREIFRGFVATRESLKV